MDEWVDGYMHGWVDGRIDGWMGGWDGRDGLTDAAHVHRKIGGRHKRTLTRHHRHVYLEIY